RLVVWRAAIQHCAVAFVVLACPSTAFSQTKLSNDDYRMVIEAARAGRHDWALQRLAQQAALHPENTRIKHDQLIVAGWAGRSDEILKLYQALPQQALPLPRAPL